LEEIQRSLSYRNPSGIENVVSSALDDSPAVKKSWNAVQLVSSCNKRRDHRKYHGGANIALVKETNQGLVEAIELLQDGASGEVNVIENFMAYVNAEELDVAIEIIDEVGAGVMDEHISDERDTVNCVKTRTLPILKKFR
jgi:hypothetical protein